MGREYISLSNAGLMWNWALMEYTMNQFSV